MAKREVYPVKKGKREQEAALRWEETAREMCLEGTPVLRWRLVRPVPEGSWRGLGPIRRYYDQLGRVWQERWEGETYARACRDLERCREEGAAFQAWEASLTCPFFWQGDGLLSLYLEETLRPGGGRRLTVPMGDTWDLSSGAPVPLSALFSGARGWRRRVLEGVEGQIRERLAGGETFLDRESLSAARTWFSPRRFYLTGEGLVIFYPMYTLARGGEGVPAFSLPRPEGAG